jgi:hypothetical protein
MALVRPDFSHFRLLESGADTTQRCPLGSAVAYFWKSSLSILSIGLTNNLQSTNNTFIVL